MHITASSLLFGLAAAATHRIDVGKSGLTFSPNTTTAAVGDTLEFHFYPKKHSVAMGPFASPCTASKTGGFFSGYVPIDSGESKTTFSVTVNSTDPIWFYCTQGTHCASGMVGVVNPKTGANTLAAYAASAKGVSAAEVPTSVFGGNLAGGSASGTASGTAGGASATSSAKPGAAVRLSGGAEMGGLIAGVAAAWAIL